MILWRTCLWKDDMRELNWSYKSESTNVEGRNEEEHG